MCENKMRRKFLILLRLVLILLAVEAVYASGYSGHYFGELTDGNTEPASNSYTISIYNWLSGAMGYVSNTVSYVGGFAEPEQSIISIDEFVKSLKLKNIHEEAEATRLLKISPKTDQNKRNYIAVIDLWKAIGIYPITNLVNTLITLEQEVMPFIKLANKTLVKPPKMDSTASFYFIQLLELLPKVKLDEDNAEIIAELIRQTHRHYVINIFNNLLQIIDLANKTFTAFPRMDSNVRVHTTLLLSRITESDRSAYNAKVIAELYNSLSTNPNYLDIMKIIGEVQPEKIIPLIELASEAFKQNQEMPWQNKGLFIRLLSYIPKESLCKKFINIWG
jgi:hypothetical protein